jgi:hypothetical protein
MPACSDRSRHKTCTILATCRNAVPRCDMNSDAVHRARQPRSLHQRVAICSSQRAGPSALSPHRHRSPWVLSQATRPSRQVCSVPQPPMQAPSTTPVPPPSAPFGSPGFPARTTWAPLPSPSAAPPAGPPWSHTAAPPTVGAFAGPQPAPPRTSRPRRITHRLQLHLR